MTTHDRQTERRRAPRIALQIPAWLGNAGGERVPIRVIDVSIYGCRVELPGIQSLHPRIWLYLSSLEAQYVRVVWNSDTFAGLEFQSPLHEAVLDNLLETSCDPVTPVMAELYDIALRSRNHAAKAPSAPATSELNDLADHCAAVVLEQLLNNKLPDDLHRHSVVSPTVGLT